MLAALHEAGHTDIVAAHFAVLRYPGPQGRRPSDVAAEAGVTNQAMNYLLGQLEQLGYLTREPDPDDRRSKRVQLTDEGIAIRDLMRATVTQVEHELEAELGPEAYHRLRALLVELNATSFVRDAGATSSPA